MNHLEAKTVLLKTPPRFSLGTIAVEAAILVGVAGILARLLA